jgi:hypothetical protein
MAASDQIFLVVDAGTPVAAFTDRIRVASNSRSAAARQPVELGEETIEMRDDAGAGVLIGSDEIPVVLVIELRDSPQ